MFKLRLACMSVVLLPLAVAGRTQTVEITVDTKVGTGQIQDWLASSDPRLVAWGAYFARENADDAAVTRMLQLVARWPPSDERDPMGRTRMDSMSAVLDTLVERSEPAPPESLSSIASSFPFQTMILASRLPIAEATPLLLGWYDNGDGEDPQRLARVAAMMLAKAPPPGFAASVLAQSRAELYVSVRDEGGYGAGSGGPACGDGVEVPPVKGWPPMFRYSIEENKMETKDPVVIEAGGDRITFNRRLAGSGWGSCFYPRPLTDETRHHLLREMLGVNSGKMQWKVQEYFSIDWENSDQYLKELAARVALEEAEMYETVEALRAEKLLTKSEYDTVRAKLTVVVSDDRKSAHGPLPMLDWRDPHTMITFANQ